MLILFNNKDGKFDTQAAGIELGRLGIEDSLAEKLVSQAAKGSREAQAAIGSVVELSINAGRLTPEQRSAFGTMTQKLKLDAATRESIEARSGGSEAQRNILLAAEIQKRGTLSPEQKLVVDQAVEEAHAQRLFELVEEGEISLTALKDQLLADLTTKGGIDEQTAAKMVMNKFKS